MSLLHSRISGQLPMTFMIFVQKVKQHKINILTTRAITYMCTAKLTECVCLLPESLLIYSLSWGVSSTLLLALTKHLHWLQLVDDFHSCWSHCHSGCMQHQVHTNGRSIWHRQCDPQRTSTTATLYLCAQTRCILSSQYIRLYRVLQNK